MPLQNRRSARRWALLGLVALLGAFACGGAQAANPAISRFEVVPSTIDVGEPATLKVAYSGGEGRVEPLGSPVPSGIDVPLEAASSTEYTLTVTGPGGARTAKTTLTVKSGLLVKVTYPAPTLTFNLPGDVPLDFVLIPPGGFMMGPLFPDQTADWPGFFEPHDSVKYATPRHEVTFTRAYYLAKYPVTTRQWKAVTGWTTPDYATKDPDVAVWNRDWFEWHQDFLAPLNKLFAGKEFRLPSEAEWEYALRAGSTTKYFWGNDFTQVDTYSWTQDTTTRVGNLWPKVGLKQPNAWGLHDMFTQIQWTEDDYHPDYIGAPSDGNPWIDAPRPVWRTARGGNWSYYSSDRPQDKYLFDAAYRIGVGFHPATTTGLRLALTIPE